MPEVGDVTIAITGSGFVSSVTGTANRITVTPTTGNVVVDIAATYVGQTSITTLGTITTGTWNATVLTGQYGGTGVANTGLTITLASGSVGNVLASDSSGNGTWQALSGIGVTSITGTANQIAASSPTGAVTLSLTNGISLGSYQATTPPTGGMIMPGQMSIGTSSPTANTQLTIAGGSQLNGVLVNGTLASSSGNPVGLYSNPTITPTGAGGTQQGFGIVCTPTITSPAGGLATAIGTYIGLTVNGAGTVTQAYGLKVDPVAVSGATATTAYGGYFWAPTGGTNKIAIYSDNLSVGFSTTTPPTNGIIVSGQSVFGGSSPSSTTVITSTISTTNPIAFQTRGSITVTSAGSGTFITGDSVTASTSVSALYGAMLGTTIGIASGQTLTTGATVWIFPNVGGSGTMTSFAALRIAGALTGSITTTNYYGIYYDGDVAANVATNSYGGYFKVPVPNSGTNKTALYADNCAIGYTVGSPIYKLTVQGDDSAAGDTTGSFGILANSNSNQRLHMGYSTAGEYGWIEAVKVGTDIEPLILSPRGGNGFVGIGTTTPGFALTVAGTTSTTTLIGRITTQNANDTLNLGTSATNFFMDRPNSGGQLILAFNTPKPAGSFNPFTVYNNATDHLEAFAVISAGSSSGTDNVVFYPFGGGGICMGGSAVFSGSYLNIVTNSAISQTLRITGTQSATDGNSNMIGIGNFPTFAPPGGSNLATASFLNPGFVVANAQTMGNATGAYINLSFASSVGTVTAAYGMLIDSGAAGGTITNGYGLRVENPVYGTTKTCISCRGRIVIGEVTGSSALNLYYTGATSSSGSGIVTGGSAQGLPAAPVRWMAIVVNGTSYAFPLYNESFV